MKKQTTKQQPKPRIKKLICDYGTSNLQIIQRDKNSVVLDIREDNKFIGVICGSDIKRIIKQNEEWAKDKNIE